LTIAAQPAAPANPHAGGVGLCHLGAGLLQHLVEVCALPFRRAVRLTGHLHLEREHMLRIEAGPSSKYCDGLSRRSFVQLGIAGMATAGLPAVLRAKQDLDAADSALDRLRTYAGVLAGEEIPYSDEVERCYGVRPVKTPEARYEAVHAELDELLVVELLQRRRQLDDALAAVRRGARGVAVARCKVEIAAAVGRASGPDATSTGIRQHVVDHRGAGAIARIHPHDAAGVGARVGDLTAWFTNEGWGL